LHECFSIDAILHDCFSIEAILHDCFSIDEILHDYFSKEAILHDCSSIEAENTLLCVSNTVNINKYTKSKSTICVGHKWYVASVLRTNTVILTARCANCQQEKRQSSTNQFSMCVNSIGFMLKVMLQSDIMNPIL